MAWSIQCRSSKTHDQGPDLGRAQRAAGAAASKIRRAAGGGPWPPTAGSPGVDREQVAAGTGAIGRRSSPRTGRSAPPSGDRLLAVALLDPEVRFRRSITGWKAIERPKDMQWPSSHVASSPSRAPELEQEPRLADPGLARDEHDLAPRPPGPRSKRVAAAAGARRSRPTKGVSPRSASTSSRVRACRAEITSQARGRLGFALERQLAEGPRVRSGPSTSRCVAAETTIRPGSASCCRRAATLVVSPTAV